MITFNVVKEPCGWAIRLGERMTTSFWSREVAISEANALAAAIRRHGERTEVVVEGAQPCATTMRPSGPSSSRLTGVRRITVEASMR